MVDIVGSQWSSSSSLYLVLHFFNPVDVFLLCIATVLDCYSFVVVEIWNSAPPKSPPFWVPQFWTSFIPQLSMLYIDYLVLSVLSGPCLIRFWEPVFPVRFSFPIGDPLNLAYFHFDPHWGNKFNGPTTSTFFSTISTTRNPTSTLSSPDSLSFSR